MIWDEIKEQIQIPDLINLQDNRCECLNGGNTKSPSCEYHPFNDILYCYKCQQGYDVIGVYGIINNLDRKESIKALAKDLSIPYESVDEDTIELYNRKKEVFNKFADICHKNLKRSEYWNKIKNKRGFSNKTMQTFKIGLVDNKIYQYMESECTVNELFEFGFINKNKNWVIGKRIVYPYLDHNNNPIYFIYRLIDKEPDFNKNAKYIKQMVKERTFVRNEIFGLNSLPKYRNKPLVITEGITDAISVIQAGFPCLSPVTIRIKKEDVENMIRYCKRFKKIVVINDNEEFKINRDGEFENSGLKGSIDTLKVLIKYGINGYIGTIPNPQKLEKIDLDEYLKSGREIKDQAVLIETLINKSIKGFDFFINSLNEESETSEINDIFDMFPQNDLIFIDKQINKIKNKTGITKKTLEKQYKLHNKEPTGFILKEEKRQKWREIADWIFEKFDIITLKDSNNIWVKTRNIYIPDDSEIVEAISDKIDEYSGNYGITFNDVIRKIKHTSLFDREDFCYNDWLINFKNGYYDIILDKFIPTEKSNKKFFYEIPYEYKNGKYKCPIFKKALNDWLMKDNIINMDDIFEFMGYTMTMNVGFKKAFMLYGDTNSGKTQFQSVLDELIGENNIADVSLQRMVKDHFGTEGMDGKILNSYDDLPRKAIYDASIFKILTGGKKKVGAEHKGGKKYRFRNVMKFWFNANEIPRVKNMRDNAFFYRWILIHFKNPVFELGKKEEVIPHFHRLITLNPDEMQGIILECIKGLKRLYKRKYFRLEIQENTRHIWNYESNSLYAFIHDNCKKDPRGKIKVNEFKEKYNLFRIERVEDVATSQALNKMLIKHGVVKRETTVENEKTYYYCGIYWKDGKISESSNLDDYLYE